MMSHNLQYINQCLQLEKKEREKWLQATSKQKSLNLVAAFRSTEQLLILLRSQLTQAAGQDF